MAFTTCFDIAGVSHFLLTVGYTTDVSLHRVKSFQVTSRPWATRGPHAPPTA